MKMILNGVDVEERFPGYEFAWQSSFERAYRRAGKSKTALIEVFGPPIFVDTEHHGGTLAFRPVRQEVVLTLEGEHECALYGLLEQKGRFTGRRHSDERLGILFFVIFAFALLALIHLGTLGYLAWETGHVPLVTKNVEQLFGIIPIVVVGGAMLPMLEIIVVMLVYYGMQRSRMSLRIHWFILWKMKRARMKEILRGLSLADEGYVKDAITNTPLLVALHG